MVASELRIGNWVLSLGKDGIWYNSRVSKLNQEEIIVGVGFKREVKPIPLSEEILIKAGFEKNIENGIMSSYDLDKLSIVLPCKLYPNGRVYFNSWAILEKSIDYLHQLQNLFHSLTGKELEIEL